MVLQVWRCFPLTSRATSMYNNFLLAKSKHCLLFTSKKLLYIAVALEVSVAIEDEQYASPRTVGVAREPQKSCVSPIMDPNCTWKHHHGWRCCPEGDPWHLLHPEVLLPLPRTSRCVHRKTSARENAVRSARYGANPASR